MRKVCCAKYPQRLNSVIKGLLAVSLLGLSGLNVKAEEFTPTTTLGENSAYTLTETPSSSADSIILYELKDKTGTYSYVDKTGQTITKSYTTKDVISHFYDLTITAESAERLTNSSMMGEIVEHFIGLTNTSDGGAIANTGTIAGITGDFINNSVNRGAYGGAILNEGGTLGPITGDFINNSSSYGGGVVSYFGEISSIKGNFINNTAQDDGGAIFEVSKLPINTIIGNFINNSAGRDGGAITSYYDEIDIISGNFINNNAGRDGGGISLSSNSTVNSINGNFIGNSAYTGGALSNKHMINNITGYFADNSASNSGGVFITSGSINLISGIFINNSTDGVGGVIRNYYSNSFSDNQAFIKILSGDFIKNRANYYGGVLYNEHKNAVIENLYGNFIQNSSGIDGGVIYNTSGTINKLAGNFIQNIAEAGFGGAIENTDNGVIGVLSGNFIENSAGRYGGAIDNYNATIENITGSFLRNTAVSDSDDVSGGAINNYSAIIENIINSDFIGNAAVSATGEAHGGAIYSDGGSIDLTAKDGYTSTFQGNYTESAGERKNNAIYLAGNAVMNMKMENGGKFLMSDGIDGTDYKLSITGDDITKTRFYLYNTINSGDVTLSNTTIDMLNSRIAVNTVNSLTVGSDTNFAADVDLANKTMDRFTAPSYGTHSGSLIVSAVNLLSDGKENVTAVLFADEGLKENAATTVKTAYTPIYRYDVSYDNRDDAGYMLFTRGGGGSNNPDTFNPAVLSAPVATLAAGQATINETFKYVFEHADAFTQLPYSERLSMIKNNQYVISTEYNENLGGLAPEFQNNGAWVRPYVTFESLNLKNGPDVDAITYGTLAGFDSDFQDLKSGWTGVTTGYVGYNGSQLNYSGNDTSMNGGLLGLTQTFYKGNFWTAITASAGATVGETSNMYGTDNFVSLLAGVGSKTGYNFEFQEGKFIFQPIMFMNYTFVNTFDYTNSAGVKIDSEPLHTIQLNPSIRFIANLKDGWQPYASVGMVWNLLNQTDTTANGITLPDMHIKPYVEYGLGVQKRWAERFTAFFQTMIRNGGRNGVAFTGGFRWSFGKDKAETVESPKIKKVIKSLDRKIAGK